MELLRTKDEARRRAVRQARGARRVLDDESVLIPTRFNFDLLFARMRASNIRGGARMSTSELYPGVGGYSASKRLVNSGVFLRMARHAGARLGRADFY